MGPFRVYSKPKQVSLFERSGRFSTLHLTLASPDDANPLFVLETQIGLLSRIARTTFGAEALIESGVFDSFAACRFLGARPAESANGESLSVSDDEFELTHLGRFRRQPGSRRCVHRTLSPGVHSSDEVARGYRWQSRRSRV